MFVVTDDGQWVNEHFARLAEVIKDYDEYLELQWIPPGQRTEEADRKNPYRIIDSRSGYVVMFASERESAEQILARLWGADNKNGSVLDRLEIENNATEALRLKERMDEDWESAQQKATQVQGDLDFNNNRQYWFGRETYPTVSSSYQDYE